MQRIYYAVFAKVKIFAALGQFHSATTTALQGIIPEINNGASGKNR
jgi:hypothetical protein